MSVQPSLTTLLAASGLLEDPLHSMPFFSISAELSDEEMSDSEDVMAPYDSPMALSPYRSPALLVWSLQTGTPASASMKQATPNNSVSPTAASSLGRAPVPRSAPLLVSAARKRRASIDAADDAPRGRPSPQSAPSSSTSLASLVTPAGAAAMAASRVRASSSSSVAMPRTALSVDDDDDDDDEMGAMDDDDLDDDDDGIKSASGPNSRHGSRSSLRTSVDFVRLSRCFHLSVADASRELNVCTTLFKKLCRRVGIRRWPYRRLRALHRQITMLRATPDDPSLPHLLGELAEMYRVPNDEQLMELLMSLPDA
jgi:hypothetical protein